MKLRDFLDAEGISAAAFAGRIGVTPVALYRYMAGGRQPRAPIVQAIMRETGGSVTPNDLLVVDAGEPSRHAGQANAA